MRIGLRWTSGVAIFCLAAAASAGSAFGQKASVGYDDTPLQPDGKWRQSSFQVSRLNPPA